MKLEDKFLKAVFFPYFCGVAFCFVTVTYFLFRYSYKCLDQLSYDNVINTEHNKSHINLMIINNLVKRTILQTKLLLEEGYSLYEFLVENSNLSLILNESTIVNGYDLSKNYSYTMANRLENETAIWFINKENHSPELLKENNSLAYLQLSVISQSIHLLYSIYSILKKSIRTIYYAFEKTDLFIVYPTSDQSEFIESINNFDDNPVWCTDEGGIIKNYYYFKCRGWYKQYQDFYEESKNKNKSYIIFPPYININKNEGIYNSNNDLIYTICKRFIEPIEKMFSNIESYTLLCVDVVPNDLFDVLDLMNVDFRGHFLITDVGFTKPFYYPKIMEYTKNSPLCDFEFNWGDDYFLEEKINFISNVTQIMNNDYIDKIYELLNENSDIKNQFFEVNVRINNSYFYKNGKLLNYSIYPIYISDKDNTYQHILSLIYIFTQESFFEHLFSYQKKYQRRLYIEIILFIFFGFTLLSMVQLSMNALAKFIKIPIKHVQYMLKGINIGGENRLEYLNSLMLKKEDENYNNPHLFNPLIDNDYENDNNERSEYFYYKKVKIKMDKKNLEKENHFFGFDEKLLQYRPKEINNLVKILLELKNILLLTSTNGKCEKIINYSTGESVFYTIKNREGIYICQSNIGNLEFQILNYDKAIYHLCLSLQNPKLKRFLGNTLSDELDMNDYLLHIINNTYNKNSSQELSNQLVKKQQTSLHTSFSQRVLSNIINNRYNKLIHFYYKFFSILQKSDKKYEELSGLFMHTSFHTINYYHKVIIQYIYLCYASNDLIKIGESILDYIEFMLKFKLKTNKKYKEYLYKKNDSIPFYQEKQNIKKIFFDKIIDWFDLFDNYISHVNENTTLGNDKTIIDAFIHNNDTNNLHEINSQSVFLFKVLIQRGHFLKGKFALICHDYTEAIYYFVKVSKSKKVVLDGLIKKRALKHLIKIAKKLKKKIVRDDLIHVNIDEDFFKLNLQAKNNNINKKNNDKNNIFYNRYFENRNSIFKKANSNEKKNDKIEITYGEKIYKIMNQISKDIDECNIKQLKDILIIVDGTNIEKNPFQTYIDESKTILKSYLLRNDRFSMFIFNSKCRMVCPMNQKKNIDIVNLVEYIKTISNKYEKIYNESYKGSYASENESESLEDLSSEISKKSNTFYQMNLKEIILSLNYCINYLLLKGVEKNEKFLLYFTHLFSRQDGYYYLNEDFLNEINNIKKDKNINLIIIGKYNSESPLFYDKSNIINNLFNGFGEKSEFVSSENMIKIKSILSCNNITNENIIFPNEIYQPKK